MRGTRLRADVASTEAQLKETTKALDRYLHAFETGSMSPERCAPRVHELTERRDELEALRRSARRTVAQCAPTQAPDRGAAQRAAR
jgi:hypothetical protein